MNENITQSFVSILPYFGSIDWYAQFLGSNAITLLPNIAYQKKWHANTMLLTGANGVTQLSVPLQGGRNQHLPFHEIKISYAQNWQHQHLQSIKSMYGRSPFFEDCYPALSLFFSKKQETLWELNNESFALLNKLLGLKLDIFINENKNTAPTEWQEITNPISYQQVFMHKMPFVPKLSMLDLLLCTGRQEILQLRNIKI